MKKLFFFITLLGILLMAEIVSAYHSFPDSTRDYRNFPNSFRRATFRERVENRVIARIDISTSFDIQNNVLIERRNTMSRTRVLDLRPRTETTVVLEPSRRGSFRSYHPFAFRYEDSYRMRSMYYVPSVIQRGYSY